MNVKQLVSRLNRIFQMYEVGKICTSDAFRKSSTGILWKKQIEPMLLLADGGMRIDLICENERAALKRESRKRVISDKDLEKLSESEESKFMDSPGILNTLENSYSTIYFVGENAYANKIYEYFSNNAGIRLKRIDESVMIYEDNHYVLHETCDGDSMILFADLFEEQEVVDKKGKGFQTFYFLRYYLNPIKTTENLQDIEQNIIPKLCEGGVKVIKVYVPDIERLTAGKKVKRKTLYWNIVRHISEERFERIRRKREHTEGLYDEVHALTNDSSKGYSLMYGNGAHINFDNGFRRTVGNPTGEVNQIYFFGPCFIRGLSFSDENTIPSMIQSKVKDSYRVLNFGSEFQTGCYIMRSLEYRRNDIVVIFSPDKKKPSAANRNVVELDLTDVYNKIEDVQKHVYDLPVHFDKVIQDAIVEAVYGCIRDVEKKRLDRSTEAVSHESGMVNLGPDAVKLGPDTVSFGPDQKRALSLASTKDQAFVKWLNGIKTKHPWDGKKSRGAIVMNCNPFTYGHRYLIETASSQVDELIIFVVQENKSFFTFEDRMMLVRKGTEDIGNVIVVPSGNYMISSMTLPGYFEKDQLQDTYLDATQDLTLFTQIAQELGITKRFAGEEPIDRFTLMYNRNMNRILPKYGIAFIEIPRKMGGDSVISASRVRKALKEHRLDEIKALVPPTTYEYLEKRMKNEGF
ncbi:MAG: adenylyltransferase/cytidyltransferase family protein [Lachnospiraceae bacterium]